MNDELNYKIIEQDLRAEFESDLKERVERYIQVKPHGIVAGTHFASVSHEATLLFRDGYYYGSIALTQAVSEALLKFMCERNSFKPEKDFENNVLKLFKRGFISEETRKSCLAIWGKRHAYHHLNPNIEKDRKKLESIAKRKLSLLRDIEKEVFSFETSKGSIIPKYPKYWDIKNGFTSAYLKLCP